MELAGRSRIRLNPNDAGDNVQDKDDDGYTNIEEYFNGTDPARHVDYTKPENNISMLHYDLLCA